MKRRIFYCILIVITILSLLFTNTAFGKENEKTDSQDLNNIALCYHGFTTNPADKSEYIGYIEDFKGQIHYLKNKGYTFVSPSQYSKWYSGNYTPNNPIATIIFDDARDSVDMAAQWLVQNKTPFGIAVIGKKLEKLNPQQGYMSWASIKNLYDSGYCEILSHTYNMHNFGLTKENDQVVAAPVLEGPSYIDDAEFVYIDSHDTQLYWDLTYVDDTTWGFPLFGTDQNTQQPITSTIKFKAKKSVQVSKVRTWASLHSPAGGGYDVSITIKINGTEVANTTILPTQYETRSQWPEREFVTIDFDRSYQIEENKTYTMTFVTHNPGNASFNIYAIPNFSGDYELATTLTNASYGANEKWPAQAGIILASNNGRVSSAQEFKQYVLNDLEMNTKVIQKYLGASWQANTTGYEENENLESLVLGGTYSDGSLADTSIQFQPEKSFIGEVLRFKQVSHLGDWYPLVIDVFINGTKVSRFSPNWQDWSWQTVNITPYQFRQGQEYTISFKTLNQSPDGTGLVRIYSDQQDLPGPTWDPSKSTWTEPDSSKFDYLPQYTVRSVEGTDVYPRGIGINNLDYTWEYSSPYTGPGKAFLEILSPTPGVTVTPTQICYPFGSYPSKQTNNKEDISPFLRQVFKQIGISSGMAVWDEGVTSLKNVRSIYSEYVIPRYLVLGNLEQTQILYDLDILTGSNP